MQRLANETWDEYRKRLKRERAKLKERLKGRILHNNLKEGRHYTKSEREVKRQKYNIKNHTGKERKRK